MRAAPSAVTAIGRHLLVQLVRTHATSARVITVARLRRLTSTHLFSGSGRERAGSRPQFVAQAAPLSVKSYGTRFSPCQDPRNPNVRVPCAETDLL